MAPSMTNILCVHGCTKTLRFIELSSPWLSVRKSRDLGYYRLQGFSFRVYLDEILSNQQHELKPSTVLLRIYAHRVMHHRVY